MTGSYSQAELLRLRESPLVCRPANLPPIEEWMGPIPEQNQAQNQGQRRIANRGKTEETLAGENTTTRRPPFEARTRSTNVTDDIILGPPKTAFASASGNRNVTKTFDSPQRSGFANNDDFSVKNDRGNLIDRHAKDGQPNQNRRSVRDDSDLWSSARQQRHSGPDNGEHSQHRNAGRGNDKDSQGASESKALRGFENHRRDGNRNSNTDNEPRRGGQGRGRNEPSWYRDEVRTAEGETQDQEAPKAPGWRDKERKGARDAERDRTRGAKPELDPEWMDSSEQEERIRIHTQEDFERWKQRMRSGNASKETSIVEQQYPHNRTASNAGTGAVKVKNDTPLVVDSSMDGFFGLWNEPKKTEAIKDQVNGTQQVTASTPAKMTKPSKFTGFFNPKPDTETRPERPSLPFSMPPADASNEDKQGFQRILNLLGQQQQRQNGKFDTPPRVQQHREPPISPSLQESKGVENIDLYNMMGARSPPANAAPQARDSEFLLKLMQQPQQSSADPTSSNIGGRRVGHETIAGLPPISNLSVSSNNLSHHPPSTQPPGFFDDSQDRDKLNPGTELKGPPPGFFDRNVPRQSSTVNQLSSFSSGIQRPPGLDSLPPGYAMHVQPQRQNMFQTPGFQAPSRAPASFPPGLIPNDRSQFGAPSGGRGAPPGFIHPTHNAPPGFPIPFNQECLPYGAFGDGANYGQGFPPGQQRR